MKIIISGGGTGGHIFPAIAIANAVKEAKPDAEILFVGAKGKMEMEKVPAAGYKITGLTVAGLQRRLTLKNLLFPFKLLAGMWQARKVVREFKPDVAVGVGGYASGPVLRVASGKGIPCLLQEQNSYPGMTNKILSKKAKKICVAYPEMERFFPTEKIVLTGNPVRQDITVKADREEAFRHFGLESGKKTILVIGGSLGARSVNEGIMNGLKDLDDDVQILWQTGKYYFNEIEKKVSEKNTGNVKILPFIKEMAYAYAVADVVISRAGALSVSEIAIAGKPAIFVPSPNVAEDHQTKNAMVMVENDAALMVKDDETDTLAGKAVEMLNDKALLEKLAGNIKKYAKPDAAAKIAEEVLKLAEG
ncbi:MAG: undecaprenyldiphospho-muramoylpentapeptide beta-N-acetylglucosaminyltransferase [Chlorobi bacterium]|nr:undecaprenyldiphospho-muramoylpentapeptide beta-N-acetylglucosaminyltransferase [Chlorobiota bacterium]